MKATLTSKSSGQKAFYPRETRIIAHRGSKINRPENTLASFAEAIRVGADGIETDIHLSKDQELIVIHDENVNRTTNGKGLVKELTLFELKKLDAGSNFANQYKGEEIITLPELLNFLVKSEFRGLLNLEVKTDKIHYPEIERHLSRLMTARKWPFHYVYSSFNFQSLEILAGLEPTAELAYLMKNEPRKIKQALECSFIQSLHPKQSWVLTHPRKAKRSTKPLRAWTCNSVTSIRKALLLNLDAIVTDKPELALRLRKELQ